MKKLFLYAAALFAANLSQAQWEPDVRLTDNAESSMTSLGMTHNIIASGDTVHVIWYDKSDGNWEIYYMRSIDEGVSWETATRLTNDPATSDWPSLAVCGSVVHVVWTDVKTGNYEIYYRRSTDGGTSWEYEQCLTNDADLSNLPTISVSGSFVHLVWVSFNTSSWSSKIHYRHSTDGGTTWGPKTWLSTDADTALNPSIASTGSDVLVVWNDNSDGNMEIYLKRSTDGGLNWEQGVRLTNDPAISNAPSISMSGPFVHIVWRDYREGISMLFYKQSVDGGLSWGEDTQITNTKAINPNISSIGTLVSVVWEDYRNGIPEIFYKCSADGGITWDTDILLNDVSTLSMHPFIAVSGTASHVVWYDDRDGNDEIYYKRGMLGANAGPDATIRAGETYTLAGEAFLTTHVEWATSGDGTFDDPTILTPVYTPGNADITAGGITLALTAYSGTGSTASDDMILTIDPLPQVPATPEGPDSLDIYFSPTSDYFTTGDLAADAYAWNLQPPSAGTIAGTSTTGTVTWNTSFKGTAFVSVKGINTCGESAFSGAFEVTVVNSIGFEEPENGEFGLCIIPNPNQGTFILEIASRIQTIVHIRITDATGLMVWEEMDVAVVNILNKTIALENLKHGIYFLTIDNGKSPLTKKIILK